ncbi:MgtC/SapB family protein [Colwellia sp. MEBiC06753]
MMELLVKTLDVAPFSWPAIITAILCGSLIGVERQIRGKPVGIRTSSLITLGTYVVLAVATTLADNNDQLVRLIGQVITGIGFLGAGVMLAKDGAVVGVTSAATIWVLAAIGILIGFGFLSQAIILASLVVVILYGVDLIEDRVVSLTKGVHRRVKSRFNGRKLP